MRITRHFAAVAVPALLLPACLSAQAPVPIPVRDTPLALTATAVFRVGAAEGNEWETFTSVSDVTFDSAGNLYVLDAGAQRIHVFDAKGKHVRSIGRRGGGPGEFVGAVGIAIDRDGQLLVNDMGKTGVQVLTTEGRYVRTIPSDDGRRILGRLRAHPQGGAVGEMQAFDTGENGLPDSLPPRSLTWLTFGTPPARRLYNVPRQPAAQSSDGPQEVGQLVAVGPPGYAPRLHWALLPGGIVAGHTAEYSLTISNAEGRPQRVLQRAIPPRKVTQRDRDRLNEQRSASRPLFIRAPGGGEGPLPSAPPPITRFAEVVPVISGLAADPAGRIWVRRGADRDAVVDLLTADGRYLGTVRGDVLPDAFGPAGLAAYIEQDELGVPIVLVRKLQLPPSAQ